MVACLVGTIVVDPIKKLWKNEFPLDLLLTCLKKFIDIYISTLQTSILNFEIDLDDIHALSSKSLQYPESRRLWAICDLKQNYDTWKIGYNLF